MTTAVSTHDAIAPRTAGIHHVAIRVTDLARSRVFYIERLGFSVLLEVPGMMICSAGGAIFGVRGPSAETNASDTFDPHRVGLDHIALACEDAAELQRVAAALASNGIQSTGVKMDETLGKEYVAFSDPDGIKWELYMM